MTEESKALLLEIKDTLARIEKQMSPELYTVRTPEEASKIFERLQGYIKSGHGIELIVRKI